ncbi:Zinc finger protein 503 [Nymphon striatum]|nr:Zinc finger protein 503 [Nymphon striatum]
MLGSSSNQYIRPDYLTPLPTTLDSKKSPLALLVQTCSQIGADTPNAKPIPQIGSKSKEKEPSKLSLNNNITKESSPPTNGPSNDEPAKITSIKSCFKPYELTSRDEAKEEQKRENRTPGSNISSVTSHSSSSASPVTIRTSRSSPSQHSTGVNGHREHDSPSPSTDNISSSKCGSSSESTPLPSSAIGSFCSVTNSIRASECSVSADPMKDGLGNSTYALASVYKPQMMLPNNLANCVGCTGPSPDSVASSFPASLMQGQNGYSPLKMGAFTPASMSSYYARIKTPTGSNVVPFCRDPLCTNCPSYGGMQGTQGSTCPSGCTQCKHDPSGLPASMLNPLLTPPGLYPSSPLLSSHGLPYVCNWINGGDTFCGKRYASPEELLQHLRTSHTSSFPGTITETALPLGLSLPTSMPGLGGCQLHYSTAPSLTSPAGLRRTYPTALDSLTASRYHPYKPTSMGAAPPLPPLAHPGLSPYYNPYMYSQRFGAAAPIKSFFAFMFRTFRRIVEREEEIDLGGRGAILRYFHLCPNRYWSMVVRKHQRNQCNATNKLNRLTRMTTRILTERLLLTEVGAPQKLHESRHPRIRLVKGKIILVQMIIHGNSSGHMHILLALLPLVMSAIFKFYHQMKRTLAADATLLSYFVALSGNFFAAVSSISNPLVQAVPSGAEAPKEDLKAGAPEAGAPEARGQLPLRRSCYGGCGGCGGCGGSFRWLTEQFGCTFGHGVDDLFRIGTEAQHHKSSGLQLIGQNFIIQQNSDHKDIAKTTCHASSFQDLIPSLGQNRKEAVISGRRELNTRKQGMAGRPHFPRFVA